MIGVDWGTSSFRAFRLADDGRILARRSAPKGILHIANGAFAETLESEIGPWRADGERHVLLSGMIGSRQGWREAPYLPCPAGAHDIAAAVLDLPTAKLVPGLSDRDDADIPEVMRGEETQIIGTGLVDGIACLPGSHSKWARVLNGRIIAFRTYLSGEAFAAIRAGTILGRMMPDAPHDQAAFADGLARARQPGHLLHHLFGVRALGLFGQLADTASASYLSGLLIGHEVAAAMKSDTDIHLIGAAHLGALYAEAITTYGGTAAIHNEDAAAAGLHRIGSQIAWT
jgi:2-dehydro-3-deoxygalactonokinase